MSRRLISGAALALALVFVTSHPARADFSAKRVISAFKGQLVITQDELPEGKNDKDTIAKIKKVQLKELTGTAQDDVTSWSFHYTAFLKKTGSSTLKMRFMKGKQLSADKRLDGIDTKAPVLTGDIHINEDEGLAKGNTYTIELVNASDVVVAKATLVMK